MARLEAAQIAWKALMSGPEFIGGNLRAAYQGCGCKGCEFQIFQCNPAVTFPDSNYLQRAFQLHQGSQGGPQDLIFAVVQEPPVIK